MTITAAVQARFARAKNISRYTAEIVRPPRRLTPEDAAAKYLRNDKGAWEKELSPMMLEPLNEIGGRRYQGIVFVGPARSSKTYSIILGGIAYIVTCAPGDTLVVQMSGEAARDFSRGDLDRSIRHSPALQERLSPRAKDDNTFDKFFRNGMMLKLGWPAVSQLSSKTLQYVFITDYDRPENRDNVDGEGPIWDLAIKRIETYMSRGKCVAESSPGEELLDANWRAISAHEAPAVPGILSLYNRGTRARWYWPCVHCGNFSEAKPGLDVFDLPPFEEVEKMVQKHDPLTLAEQYARVVCKACGGVHTMADRPQMNMRGTWVHEGEKIIDDKGTKEGERRRTGIVSYWLGGVAATYQRWDGLLQKYFQGVLTYVRTGDEQSLKGTTNTDQAAPYISRNIARHRGPETLIARSREGKWEKGTVPPGVRFLTAAIDVQLRHFAVQVQGWGTGLQSWIVDYFQISMSNRMESETRNAAVDPASYLEDWDLLIDEVIKKTYPLAANPGILIGVKFAVCDSGGREGVTARAYDFWRKLRAMALGDRLNLIKGDGRLSSPRCTLTWPDNRAKAGRTARLAHARGDVPVHLINTNMLKDAVSNDIGRDQAGPGFIHFPHWLDNEYFNGLTAETRNEKGEWENLGRARNEPLDLTVYNRAACIVLNAEKINWDSPPEWAVDPSLRKEEQVQRVDFSALSRQLNG